MKYLGLSKIFSYYEVTSEELDDDALEQRFDNFRKELVELFDKHGVKFADSYTAFYGMEKYSICNCQKCNQLMLNRDKNPAGFSEHPSDETGLVVYDGGESEGRILCEECLPATHRWGVGNNV
jgi:hypothetical protein